MAASTPPSPKIDIKAIANDSGVAVEAYDTYDSDEETMAAAHRFAAGLLNRVAVICESQPGLKVMDAAALRRLAQAMLPG
jgi:cystathionine beta-lyase/cystathionine gamma-synthase